MENGALNNNTLIAKLIDFVLIATTFYFSCSFLSSYSQGNILLQALVYSTVILVSVGFGKRLLSLIYKPMNTVLGLMIRNATGLFIGASVMMVISIVVPVMDQVSIVIVVSSIMVFFVLGTISTLLNIEKNSSNTHLRSK